MFFVFGFDAGTATDEILEATGFETDHVEILIGMQALFVATEVL